MSLRVNKSQNSMIVFWLQSASKLIEAVKFKTIEISRFIYCFLFLSQDGRILS